MNFLAYINIIIAVLGLLCVIYALRVMPYRRCSEPMVGDAMVLVAYLLMINSHWVAQQTPYLEITTRAWHVFDMVVLINVAFHAHHYASRRKRVSDQ